MAKLAWLSVLALWPAWAWAQPPAVDPEALGHLSEATRSAFEPTLAQIAQLDSQLEAARLLLSDAEAAAAPVDPTGQARDVDRSIFAIRPPERQDRIAEATAAYDDAVTALHVARTDRAARKGAWEQARREGSSGVEIAESTWLASEASLDVAHRDLAAARGRLRAARSAAGDPASSERTATADDLAQETRWIGTADLGPGPVDPAVQAASDRIVFLSAHRQALAAELELARAVAVNASGGSIDLAPFRSSAQQADLAWADLQRVEATRTAPGTAADARPADGSSSARDQP